MFAFDEDTAVRAAGEGVWDATVAGRWNVFGVPNGGYVMGVGLSAVLARLPDVEPLTATAHFLRPAVPDGPATVAVEVLRSGRTFHTATAALTQEGKERMRMLVTLGELDSGGAPTLVTGAPPDLAEPEHYPSPEPAHFPVEIARRFDYRGPHDPGRVFSGPTAGVAEIGGWIRFADGRPPDLRSFPLFADSFPPPIFNVVPPNWVPTLEMTVHFRARPAPGWLLAWFRTRFVMSGYLEEDGEVWDSAGNLVALSRQLARLPG